VTMLVAVRRQAVENALYLLSALPRRHDRAEGARAALGDRVRGGGGAGLQAMPEARSG